MPNLWVDFYDDSLAGKDYRVSGELQAVGLNGQGAGPYPALVVQDVPDTKFSNLRVFAAGGHWFEGSVAEKSDDGSRRYYVERAPAKAINLMEAGPDNMFTRAKSVADNTVPAPEMIMEAKADPTGDPVSVDAIAADPTAVDAIVAAATKKKK